MYFGILHAQTSATFYFTSFPVWIIAWVVMWFMMMIDSLIYASHAHRLSHAYSSNADLSTATKPQVDLLAFSFTRRQQRRINIKSLHYDLTLPSYKGNLLQECPGESVKAAVFKELVQSPTEGFSFKSFILIISFLNNPFATKRANLRGTSMWVYIQ